MANPLDLLDPSLRPEYSAGRKAARIGEPFDLEKSPEWKKGWWGFFRRFVGKDVKEGFIQITKE